MRPWKVLVLCTGNSARSILAEYLINKRGAGRFEAHSAGAAPSGRVHPLSLWVLRERFGIDAGGARSKSWDEFRDTAFDLIITVCDNARESCPVWPGKPVVAHWSSPDPAALEGTQEEKQRMFVDVAVQISRRVDLLCALADAALNQRALDEIGRSGQWDG